MSASAPEPTVRQPVQEFAAQDLLIPGGMDPFAVTARHQIRYGYSDAELLNLLLTWFGQMGKGESWSTMLWETEKELQRQEELQAKETLGPYDPTGQFDHYQT